MPAMTSSMEPGIITVSDSATGTIDAVGVKLHIAIQGQNVLFGNAALERTQEVKAAVARIRELDKAAAITLGGVSFQADGGWLKGTKGRYLLTARLGGIERINEVLVGLMDIKNLALESIEWEYDEHKAGMQLLQQAIQRCRAKAEVMAGALGLQIDGIKSCSDMVKTEGEAWHRPPPGGGGFGSGSFKKAARLQGAVDLGLEVQGRTEISVHVQVAYSLRTP